LLFAWETLLPTIGFFPVTWQTRAITHSLKDIPQLEKQEYIQKTQLFQSLA
jgi:hypothetical protein